MKALSIREPWASAILDFGKDVENRDWSTAIRGKIAIHAIRPGCFDDLRDDLNACDRDSGGLITRVGMVAWAKKILPDWPVYRSGIIGVADLVDCVASSHSPWFVGRYGFILQNARPLGTPIPCRGALRFWNLPPEIEDRVLKEVG